MAVVLPCANLCHVPEHIRAYPVFGPSWLHPAIRRLGLVFFLLQLGCVFYFVYAVLWQQGYLVFSTATGTVRVSKTGTGIQLSTTYNASAAPYCNDAHRLAWNAAYPTQAFSACRIWDAEDLVQSSDYDLGITIISGAKLSYSACKLCLNFTAGLSYVDFDKPPTVATDAGVWATTKSEQFYTVQPENIELWIDHSMSTEFSAGIPSSDSANLELYSSSSTISRGTLVDKDGATIKTFLPYYEELQLLPIDPTTTKRTKATLLAAPAANLSSLEAVGVYELYKTSRNCRVLVSDLLAAAGVSLDDVSDVPGIGNVYGPLSGPWGPHGFHSINRKWGLILKVTISYSNTYSFWAPSPVQYTMTVDHLEGEEYSFYTNYQNSADFSTRVLMKHSGVHVYFVQVGQIAKFSFTTLWITIFSTLGFFTVAQIAIIFIALYLAPSQVQLDMRHLFDKTKKNLHMADIVQELTRLRSLGRERLTKRASAHSLLHGHGHHGAANGPSPNQVAPGGDAGVGSRSGENGATAGSVSGARVSVASGHHTRFGEGGESPSPAASRLESMGGAGTGTTAEEAEEEDASKLAAFLQLTDGLFSPRGDGSDDGATLMPPAPQAMTGPDSAMAGEVRELRAQLAAMQLALGRLAAPTCGPSETNGPAANGAAAEEGVPASGPVHAASVVPVLGQIPVVGRLPSAVGLDL